MHNLDFSAHQHLSGSSLNNIQQAVVKANEKAHMGQFNVCITHAGEVLVLPEFSASVRNDITEFVYNTDNGYNIANN